MIPIAILVIADDDDREFMIRLYLDHKGLIYSRISSIVKTLMTRKTLCRTL